MAVSSLSPEFFCATLPEVYCETVDSSLSDSFFAHNFAGIGDYATHVVFAIDQMSEKLDQEEKDDDLELDNGSTRSGACDTEEKEKLRTLFTVLLQEEFFPVSQFHGFEQFYAVAQEQNFTTKAGSSMRLAPQLLLLNTGKGSLKEWRKAGNALAKHKVSQDNRYKISPQLLDPSPWEGNGNTLQDSLHNAQEFISGYLLAGYHAPLSGLQAQETAAEKALSSLILVTSQTFGKNERWLQKTLLSAEAVYHARNLANMPPNIKNPVWMGDQAKELIKNTGCKNLSDSI